MPDRTSPIPARRLLPLSRVAENCAVHERTVRRWIAQGHVTAYRLPGSRLIRVDAAEIDKLLRPIPAGGAA